MWKVNASISVLLAGFVLTSVAAGQIASGHKEKDAAVMKRVEQEYGKPNPKAPPELSRFAFLVGRWDCVAKIKRDDGTWENLKATWEGRYILDGYAIADEYRMFSTAGELIVLGLNFRAYDAKKKTWNLKWLNALGGNWVDLGSEELGGVKIDEKGITYSMKEPLAPHVFTRATYTNISENHFTWRGEKSDDGKRWEEFMVIEAERGKD